MGTRSYDRASVIIVTCATGDHLKKCLDSLKAQTHPAQEILVIDNSLNQEFHQEIARAYSFARMISSPQKLSYCASLNKGIASSRGEFILCLNDDVVLAPGFIEEALKGFLVDEKTGMVSGKILRSDKKTIDTTGLFLSCFRTAKERGYGLKDKGQFEQEGYIFGVGGAAGFYLKDMLEDIREGEDYFDSDFHFFYEDLDVAWRAQRRGWKGYYMPRAIAYHARGASVRKSGGANRPCARRFITDELHWDLIKNRYMTLVKNESCLGFLSHILFLLPYDLLIAGYILFFRPSLIKEFFSLTKFLKIAHEKRGSSRR